MSILPGKNYEIVVTEFYHHGEIDEQGSNVLVVARKSQQPVPTDVLQLGPGDFCRVAFQTVDQERVYDVFYGGQPPAEEPPVWTSRVGLLLETRQYSRCDLSSVDAVREAFEAAEPYGADYVDAVQQAQNPFRLAVEPFLSRYRGLMRITRTGTYGFYTSSRDASFLLIDGNVVASAPGVHGPAYRAAPNSRKEVQLSAGEHEFEYYHAAAGTNAVMLAAWEVPPLGERPAPTLIPGDVFRTRSVAHLPAGPVVMHDGRLVPEFSAKIEGDVPLVDSPDPLVAVLFRDRSAKALTMQGKVLWDFGDGQTATKLAADHVYLRPGVYKVTLTLWRSGRPVSISNRIEVDRPFLTRRDNDRFHTLDECFPILETYDPSRLDAASLRQLVLAYLTKVAALEAVEEDASLHADALATDDNLAPGARRPGVAQGDTGPVDEEIGRYLTAAVEAGKVAFTDQSAAEGDQELYRLASLIGPIARDRLAQPIIAGQIWHGASKRISAEHLKAECEIEAADIALNDLQSAPVAKRFLDMAASRAEGMTRGSLPAELNRVWGDYYAQTGDGEAARKAYEASGLALGSTRRYSEQTARRGAHARSTEDYIRSGDYERAVEEIRQWQSEFPAEKIDGYLTLLYAQYWAGRGQYAQAIAQTEQLAAVNPDSPYLDQALLLAADCEYRRGKADRALATLRALLRDHPGSPLVPKAQEGIERLEDGE